MKKKIVFFHLLNNYTGSPLVLKNVIALVLGQGYEVELYTSTTKGFLSDIPGVTYHNNYYKRFNQRIFTLFSFFISQGWLAFQTLLRHFKTDEIFYVNTILPFGSILVGRLLGKNVITHIHEYEISPRILNKFLFGVVNQFSSKVIVVSEFLKYNPALKRRDTEVIHNCVTESFESRASPKLTPSSPFQVLMLASLRSYKGISEFIQLGYLLPQVSFKLVVSDDEESLQLFLAETQLPENLRIFPVQQDVHPFFSQADLILNLTDKSKCIETFGLTVLEGMYYGMPAIVPTVGGITELVGEGENGFHIDSKNIDQLASKIREISEDRDYWIFLHRNCLLTKEKFSREVFNQKISKILSK